jgi:hypothetical protein
MNRAARGSRDRNSPSPYSPTSTFTYHDFLLDEHLERCNSHSRVLHRDNRTSGINLSRIVDNQALVPHRLVEMSSSEYRRPGVHFEEGDEVDLGDAMSSLHTEIERAQSFYGAFMSSYKTEIAPLLYLPRENLRAIWASKVTGSDHRHDQGRNIETAPVENVEQNYHNQEAPQTSLPKKPPKKNAHKFADIERGIKKALQYAVRSRTGQNVSTVESVAHGERLIEKVRLAETQIRRILGDSTRSYDDCYALHSELGTLKSLIDPDNELNRLAFGDDEAEIENAQG